MDQRAFLAAIVPWESGYVSINWRRSDLDKWSGRFVRSLDDALRVIDALIAGPNDIYVCLSSQKEVLRQRKGLNAAALKATWADIDVNMVPPGHSDHDPDKYDTVDQAVISVYEFCIAAKIPNPSLVVLTGGGVHVYWLSDRVLLVKEWRKYANGLKAAMRIHGLKADAGLTTDAVRLLRIIRTFNNKYSPPRPVRLFPRCCNGACHDFSVVFADLVALRPPVEAAREEPMIDVAPAFKHLGTGQPLGEGIEFDKRPIPLEPILPQCGFLHEAWETGGKNFDNTLWNLVNLICTFLENGNELIHRLGHQHPDYSYDETEKEWDRKNRERRDSRLGWPQCRTIQDNGCSHCDSCPHLILNKSPLNIGYAAPSQPAAAVTDEDEEISALGGERPPHLRLPEGFCRSKARKQICAVIRDVTTTKKVIPGRLVPLFNGQFDNVSLLRHGATMGIAFTATTDREETVDMFLSVDDCCNRVKLYNYMSKKNVGHIVDIEIENMGAKFTSSWLDLLQAEDVAVREQGAMGWQFDKDGRHSGFAYGGKLHRTDGTALALRIVNDDEFHSWYKPVGQREVWLKAAKLLTDRRRPELDIIMSIAFAAPLTAFVGTLYGAILSVWGDPGTAKSTAQQVAAAVWGHPKQTRESLTSTPKSVQGRLGRTRNLPAYWDDVQDERHQEALFQTMFVASEGTEGGRLNSDASYKQRLEWQTLLVACSNASFVDYLTRKQRSTTAGIRRVFEIEFRKRDDDVGMIDALDASRTFAQLEHNYGVIGAEYAALLAREHTEVDALMAETVRRFSKTVSAVGDESFWLGICSTLIAGATLANRLGAEMDLVGMEEYLNYAFLNNRYIRRDEGSEAGTYANTERALTDFLNTYGRSNTLFVDKNFVHRNEPINPLSWPQPGRPVYVQVSRDERTIRISKKALRDYLWDSNTQPQPVFAGLKKWLGAKETRLTLGGGTAYTGTQEQCIEILVPIGQHMFLDGFISARGPAA
jgi:Domain of unknown function (DUF927)